MKTISLGLDQAGFRQLLDALRFRYRKWDVFACGRCLILPEAIVLTSAEHQRVVATVERFHRILGELENCLARAPEELAYLGIPPEVADLIAHEHGDGALQLARYDLFPDPAGRWWVSEFNEDVPGGFNEAVGIPELLNGGLPAGRFTGDLRAALQGAFRGAQRVAFIHATGYSEDLQHMLVVRDWLEQVGIEGVLCSPAHLRARRNHAEFLGQRVDMAMRCYPGEWFRWLPNLDEWRRAVANLPQMNPLRRLVRQSKKLFIRWAAEDLVTADDRAFLFEHAPLSLPFQPEPRDRWLTEQSRWVLKEAFGRMGDTVVIGALVNATDWQRALDEAAKRPADFLMQTRFEVAPLEFAAGPMYPALGAFLVNGRFAGYYSRADPRPLLTHEAYHVATLVETI
jgi:glutathionylspermidine synthase